MVVTSASVTPSSAVGLVLIRLPQRPPWTISRAQFKRYHFNMGGFLLYEFIDDGNL